MRFGFDEFVSPRLEAVGSSNWVFKAMKWGGLEPCGVSGGEVTEVVFAALAKIVGKGKHMKVVFFRWIAQK